VTRTGRTLLAALVGATTVLLPSVASAHDQLIGSGPADGSRIATFPSEVSLEFNNEPLDLGASIVVVDTDDRDYATRLTFDGTVVSTQLDAAPADANYQVRWRVVSSDGHVISGAFDFAVGDTSEAEDFPPRVGTGSVTVATDNPAAASEDGATRTAVVAVVGAFLALGLWAAIARLRTTTRSRQET